MPKQGKVRQVPIYRELETLYVWLATVTARAPKTPAWEVLCVQIHTDAFHALCCAEAGVNTEDSANKLELIDLLTKDIKRVKTIFRLFCRMSATMQPRVVPQIRLYLSIRLHIKLHKDKFYCQPISHGVAFIGYVIKPYRIYVNNTLVSHTADKMHEMNLYCRKLIKKDFVLTNIDKYTLEKFVCSLNSFMGFMVHAATYGIRRSYLHNYKYVWKFAYYDRCRIIKIKRKYKLKVKPIRSKRYGRKNKRTHIHRSWKDVRSTPISNQLCT